MKIPLCRQTRVINFGVMYHDFNIINWKRKDAYQLFSTYDNPFFNLCSHIDVTSLYRFCKDNDYSFNLSLLFYSLQSANNIEEFKLRIFNGRVVLFDKINGGSTVLHEDETFSFCYFEMTNLLNDFEKAGKKLLRRRSKPGHWIPRQTNSM